MYVVYVITRTSSSIPINSFCSTFQRLWVQLVMARDEWNILNATILAPGASVYSRTPGGSTRRNADFSVVMLTNNIARFRFRDRVRERVSDV